MDNSRKFGRSLPPRRVQWERYSHFVAGVSGGAVSTFLLHPLDLVKIRFQVNEGSATAAIRPTTTARPEYKGLTDAFRTIWRSQGYQGLYQGVTPNVWGAGLSWGLYFFFYNNVKLWMQDGNTQHSLGPAKNMLAAADAGLITLMLTNPIWVTKTRICLQYEGGATTAGSVHYKGMLDALLKIYKFEGIRGLYRGFVPGMFGISHGALQFMVYEEMKSSYNTYLNRPIDHRMGTLEYLAFSAMSKVVAAVATYPYQVIRSRLQDQHGHYSGVRDVIRKVWRYEGWKGFYKGLLPNILRVTPACCITFAVYENIITYCKNIKTEEDLAVIPTDSESSENKKE